VPIGKWVLKTACQQNVAWQKQGLTEFGIAVNLTLRQFSDENLLRDIAGILRETGMQPTLLELEISESMLFHDIDKTLRIMAGLKTIGVKIAVDDFGTCYASLAKLRQFPIDTIKIRRPASDSTPEKEAFAQAIFAVGRTLSMTVVALGVETKDQAAHLQGHACDEVQGFYFDNPLPAQEVTQRLRSEAEASLVS
jgi:EAL domain-containing protein (putative c-di-GMP-specific phosphodiesterase class I)